MARRSTSKSVAPRNRFKGKDIISVSQFTTVDLSYLFNLADWMSQKIEKGETLNLLTGKLMTALFYEPSSRTFGSFVAAMQRLGGNAIQMQEITYSSVAKGESLPDTVRTFESYSDVIVLRHPEVGSSKIAAKAAKIPVINAGDGVGEHPTQALLDLYTIKEELGRLNNLKVILGGDLLNGRTVHSLSRLLALYPKIELFLVSPVVLKMPENLLKRLKKRVEIFETENLKEVIKKADVIYWTRVQKERFAGQTLKKLCHLLSQKGFDLNSETQSVIGDLAQKFSQVSYEEVRNLYVITSKIMKMAKKKMILMHPLPRVNEIDPKIDSDPRAVYLKKQMRNGMYVRMALLAAVLGRVPPEF